MKAFKSALYGIFLAAIFPFFVEIIPYQETSLTTPFWWGVCFAGFVTGACIARFISWGWTLGGALGLCAGIYIPLSLMYFFPDTSYERVLPWLMLSGVAGLIFGGYGLNRFFKSRYPQASEQATRRN